jgi:luciferase family oxidoreductase group 1
MAVELSILDLAPIAREQTATDSFAASVSLAREAERFGYKRVWYAEHHNMASIASSATSVLIAHVAAHTDTIRLGAGGVMLPNHAPLVIAEQFGTLAALHPGRIDLGLGRAPGSDQNTMSALRRDLNSAANFPDDVRELQGYLSGHSLIPGVDAVPGKARTYRSTSLGHLCSGRNSLRLSACRMRSHRISRLRCLTRRWLPTVTNSSLLRRSNVRTHSQASTS